MRHLPILTSLWDHQDPNKGHSLPVLDSVFPLVWGMFPSTLPSATDLQSESKKDFIPRLHELLTPWRKHQILSTSTFLSSANQIRWDLGFLFCGCDQSVLIKSNLEESMWIKHYRHHGGKPGRELKAGAWSPTLKQRPWQNTAGPLGSCWALLLTSSGPYSKRGIIYSGMGTSHINHHEKVHHRQVPRPIWRGQFLN